MLRALDRKKFSRPSAPPAYGPILTSNVSRDKSANPGAHHPQSEVGELRTDMPRPRHPRRTAHVSSASEEMLLLRAPHCRTHTAAPSCAIIWARPRTRVCVLTRVSCRAPGGGGGSARVA